MCSRASPSTTKWPKDQVSGSQDRERKDFMSRHIEERLAKARKLIDEATSAESLNLMLAAREMLGLLDIVQDDPRIWATGAAALEHLRALHGGASAPRVEPNDTLRTYFDLAIKKWRSGDLGEVLELCRSLLWARVEWEPPWRCGLDVARVVVLQRTQGLKQIAV